MIPAGGNVGNRALWVAMDPENDSETETRAPVPADDVSPALAEEAARSVHSSGKRLAVLFMVAGGLVALVHFTPLMKYVHDIQLWRSHLEGMGFLGWLTFFVASTALLAAGTPRMILCLMAGVLFGFLEGFLLAQFSGLLGAYLTFLFARWAGEGWIAGLVSRREKLKKWVARPTVSSVFLLRQLPITAVVQNLFLGLTLVTHQVFLVGTFLGLLPSTAVVVLVGSGLVGVSLKESLGQISLALAALAGFAVLSWRLRKKRPWRSGT